jgi:predicted nucleic acid-binding protein
MSTVLVDTSVWIDHLHRNDARLTALLETNLVVAHPLVIGELALGSIRNRATVLGLLAQLPRAAVASSDEVLLLVQDRRLYGRGLSLVDAHLLASALIGPDTRILTRDRRLAEVCGEAGVLWQT